MLRDEIACLALDVGGVICADIWETLFKEGLAAHYGLELEKAMNYGSTIWEQHAYATSSEKAYWTSWEMMLGYAFDPQVVSDLQAKSVWVDSSTVPLVEMCLSRGIDVCFISNNTSFWFPQQMKSSGLDALLPRMKNHYLSYEIGVSKTHAVGGLAQLAKRHDPPAILFVDDRSGNIGRAQELGMQTLHYIRKDECKLAEALAEKLLSSRPDGFL